MQMHIFVNVRFLTTITHKDSFCIVVLSTGLQHYQSPLNYLACLKIIGRQSRKNSNYAYDAHTHTV